MDEFYTTKNATRYDFIKAAKTQVIEKIETIELTIHKLNESMNDILKYTELGSVDAKVQKTISYEVSRVLKVEQKGDVAEYVPMLQNYEKYLKQLLFTLNTKRQNTEQILRTKLHLLNSEVLRVLDNHYVRNKIYSDNEKDVILWKSMQMFIKKMQDKKIDIQNTQIISLKTEKINFRYRLQVSRKIHTLEDLFMHMDAYSEVPLIIRKNKEKEHVWYQSNSNAKMLYQLTKKITQDIDRENVILCLTEDGKHFTIDKLPRHSPGVFGIESNSNISMYQISKIFGLKHENTIYSTHAACLEGYSYEMDFDLNLYANEKLRNIEIYAGNAQVDYEIEFRINTPNKVLLRERVSDKVRDVKDYAVWLSSGTTVYGKIVDEIWAHVKDKSTNKEGFIKLQYLHIIEENNKENGILVKLNSTTALSREDIKIKIQTKGSGHFPDVYLPLIVYDLQEEENREEASIGIILSGFHPDFDELRKSIHLSDDNLFYINENETISEMIIVANTQYSGQNIREYTSMPNISFRIQRNSNIITIVFSMNMLKYVNLITTCFVSFVLSFEQTSNFEYIQINGEKQSTEVSEIEQDMIDEEEEEDVGDEEDDETQGVELPGYWKFIDMARYRKKDAQNQKKIQGVVTLPHVLVLDQIVSLLGSSTDMENKWCMKYPLSTETNRIKMDALDQNTMVPFAIFSRLEDLYFMPDINSDVQLYPAITHIGVNTNKSFFSYLPKIFDYKTHVLEGRLSHRSKGELVASITEIEKNYLVFTYQMLRYTLFHMKSEQSDLYLMQYFIICNFFRITGFPIMKQAEMRDIFAIDDLNKENVYFKSTKAKLNSLPKHNIDEVIPTTLEKSDVQKSIALLEKCLHALPELKCDMLTQQKGIKTIRSYEPLNSSHFAQIKKAEKITHVSNQAAIGTLHQYQQSSLGIEKITDRTGIQFEKDMDILSSFVKGKIDFDISWKDVPRDNSCFYHCINEGLNLELTTDELRNQVAEFLMVKTQEEKDQNEIDRIFTIAISDFYDETDLDLEKKIQLFIQNTKEEDWGNEITISAFSYIYNDVKFIYVVPHLQYIFCIQNGESLSIDKCASANDKRTLIIGNTNGHFIYGAYEPTDITFEGGGKRGRPPGSKNKPKISPAKAKSPTKVPIEEPTSEEILEAIQIFKKYKHNADNNILMITYLSHALGVDTSRATEIINWCLTKDLFDFDITELSIYRSGVHGGKTNLYRCIERCSQSTINGATSCLDSEFIETTQTNDILDSLNFLESKFNCIIFIFDYCIDDVNKIDYLDISEHFSTYYFKQVPVIKDNETPCYFLCKHSTNHYEPIFALIGKKMEFNWRAIYHKHFKIDISIHIRNLVCLNYNIDTQCDSPPICINPKKDNISFSEWVNNYLSDKELMYTYSLIKNGSFDQLMREYAVSYRFGMFHSVLFQNYETFFKYWSVYKEKCNVKNTQQCILDLLKNYHWVEALHDEIQNDTKYYQIVNLLPIIEKYFRSNPENTLFDNEMANMKDQIIQEMTNDLGMFERICSGFSMATSIVCKNKNVYITTANDQDKHIHTIYHLISQMCNVDGFVNMFQARKVLEINNKSSKTAAKLALIIPKFKIQKLALNSFNTEYNLKQTLFTHEFDARNPCLSYLILEIDSSYTSLAQMSFFSTYTKNSIYSNLFDILCHICSTKAKTYAKHLGINSVYLPSSRVATTDTVSILGDSCEIISDQDFNSLLTAYLQKCNDSITKGTNDATLAQSHFSGESGVLLLPRAIFDTISIKLLKSPLFVEKQKFFGKKITDIFWNNLLAAEHTFRINFYNHTIPNRNIKHGSIFEQQNKIYNYFPYKYETFLFRRRDFLSGALFVANVYNSNTVHRISDIQVNQWELIDNKLHKTATISSSYDHLIVCDDATVFIHLQLVDSVQDHSYEHDIRKILDKKITFTDQNSENSSKYEAQQKYFEIRNIDSQFVSIQADTDSLPEFISIKISKTTKSTIGLILADISKSTNTTPDVVRNIFLDWFRNGMLSGALDPFVNMIRFVTQDGKHPYGISFTKTSNEFSIDSSDFVQKWGDNQATLSRLDMILLSQAFKGILIGIYTPTSDPFMFEKKVAHGYHFSDVFPAADLVDPCTFMYVKFDDGLHKIVSM